mgnify:CR=1 FL=1
MYENRVFKKSINSIHTIFHGISFILANLKMRSWKRRGANALAQRRRVYAEGVSSLSPVEFGVIDLPSSISRAVSAA